MNRCTTSAFLLFILVLSGCASSRVVRLENRVLLGENEAMLQKIQELQANQVDPTSFTMNVTLEKISELLTKSGYQHDVIQDKSHIQMEYTGKHTQFGINIQYYDKAKVVYIATNKYFALDQAQNTSSVVLLAVKLMALNYEMLLGKFQMNPESGEILLSTELYVGNGLGHATLMQALDHLCRIADDKYDELKRAASGVGL